MIRTVLIASVVGVVGLLVGRHLGARSSRQAQVAASEPPGEPWAAAAPPSRCVAVVDPAMLRAELALALKQAGVAAPTSAPAEAVAVAAPEPAAPAPKSAPTPDQLEKAERARAVVETSVAQGHMDQAHEDELRALMPALADDERHELMRALIVATNRNKLALDDHHLPF
jgi:hypothetical protein